MCGFAEVRRRADGMYFCRECGVTLGKAFRERVAVSSPDKLRLLDEQCAKPEVLTPPEKPYRDGEY